MFVEILQPVQSWCTSTVYVVSHPCNTKGHSKSFKVNMPACKIALTFGIAIAIFYFSDFIFFFSFFFSNAHVWENWISLFYVTDFTLSSNKKHALLSLERSSKALAKRLNRLIDDLRNLATIFLQNSRFDALCNFIIKYFHLWSCTMWNVTFLECRSALGWLMVARHAYTTDERSSQTFIECNLKWRSS